MLAAVTIGIYIGWRAPEISSARQRMAGYSMWTILTFLLNALLFVLIGLQLPLILDGLRDEPLGELIGIAAVSLGGGDRVPAGVDAPDDRR